MIVTDLEMPQFNGLELVQAIHQKFQTPVVLTTARGSEEIASEAMQKRAASYVPKRFLEDLVSTLQRMLAVTRADLAGMQLADCATYSEVRFCLSSDSRLVGPLVA
jgi:DNA-binding NtrC family response regulator